jgi:hypothetical protein
MAETNLFRPDSFCYVVVLYLFSTYLIFVISMILFWTATSVRVTIRSMKYRLCLRPIHPRDAFRASCVQQIVHHALLGDVRCIAANLETGQSAQVSTAVQVCPKDISPHGELRSELDPARKCDVYAKKMMKR